MQFSHCAQHCAQYCTVYPDLKPTIAFLDTNVSTLPNGEVEVHVYRKATHTNEYLAIHTTLHNIRDPSSAR